MVSKHLCCLVVEKFKYSFLPFIDETTLLCNS
jgi:hypothetical protein